jgi:hypothetical protein
VESKLKYPYEEPGVRDRNEILGENSNHCFEVDQDSPLFRDAYTAAKTGFGELTFARIGEAHESAYV